jgi:hypothetical protein
MNYGSDRIEGWAGYTFMEVEVESVTVGAASAISKFFKKGIRFHKTTDVMDDVVRD